MIFGSLCGLIENEFNGRLRCVYNIYLYWFYPHRIEYAIKSRGRSTGDTPIKAHISTSLFERVMNCMYTNNWQINVIKKQMLRNADLCRLRGLPENRLTNEPEIISHMGVEKKKSVHLTRTTNFSFLNWDIDQIKSNYHNNIYMIYIFIFWCSTEAV